MLILEDFKEFMRRGPTALAKPVVEADAPAAKTGGFKKPGKAGFTKPQPAKPAASAGKPSAATGSFARRLLELSGFGNAERFPRAQLLLGDDAVLGYLPDHLYYFRTSGERGYHTLLLEVDEPASAFLKHPAFAGAAKGLDLLEDALERVCQSTLKGFAHGQSTASRGIRPAGVPGARQEETICVVSILDDRGRDGQSNLVYFGASIAGSLESFSIRQEAIDWEEQLGQEYLDRVHTRHFKRLAEGDWAKAFLSEDERRCARRLSDACKADTPKEESIKVAAIDLLEQIALSYGLRAKDGKRLERVILPGDHDIGVDPAEAEKDGFKNPFQGVILRDMKQRLLGYIVYCLDSIGAAATLRDHLAKHNRFHNVLVIYPGADGANLELWQGKKPLTGKLRKSGSLYENEGKIINLLSRFFVVSRNTISNPTELAEELAYRARYLKQLALRQLQDNAHSELHELYANFKKSLVHDQTLEQFADTYAQTLTYGLLAARWVSKDEFVKNKERFTRVKAGSYLPATSPFLKELFNRVLDIAFEPKLAWLLDDISDLLDRTDVNDVFSPEKTTDETTGHDPVIHFYEPFLAAYDPKLRRQRGVYYTPQPVVSFIVRSVDEILRTEFKLADGLADTATWGDMKKRFPDLKIPRHATPDTPFVQILDPATGTGTFLVEVIDCIHRTLMAKWDGAPDEQVQKRWDEYVHEHLLPRMNGFELMVASYTIAHLKVALKLEEMGYRFRRGERLRIFLTNALEGPHETIQGDLFNPIVGDEAMAATQVKKGCAVTVVIGNPPYAGHSANKGDWITRLLHGQDTFLKCETEDYFQCDGEPLGERNPKWLYDDYVKFVRLSQWYLMRGRLGVHGMITNHSYLDNPTFKGLRGSLVKSCNSMHVVDLHGNSKKREVAADGTADKNVFDIQQGVAISLFSFGLGTRESPSVIRRSDVLGSREYKYAALSSASLVNPASIVANSAPYLFSRRDDLVEEEWQSFALLTELLRKSFWGVATRKDYLLVDFDEKAITERFEAILGGNLADASRLGVRDNKYWSIANVKRQLGTQVCGRVRPYVYRPFDVRFIFYDKLMIERGDHRYPLVRNYSDGRENIGLLVSRTGSAAGGPEWNVVMVSSTISDLNLFRRGGAFVFPLREYELHGSGWTTNLREDQVAFFRELRDVSDTEPEILWLRYTYAILHSPGYRSRYRASLDSSWPRIPTSIPASLAKKLVVLGEQLVALHDVADWPADFPPFAGMTRFPIRGSNKVEIAGESGKKLTVVDGVGRVYINKTQYFENVPEEAWEFHVGGYQVCHKWLSDRKGRTLSDEDIEHYCRIIAVIKRTIEIMAEIDEVIDQHGGWPDAFVTQDEGKNG